MPCDTQRTITTDLAAADPEVLGRGLVAAGFTMTLLPDARTIAISDRSGTVVATLLGKQLSGSSEATLSVIKKAYAAEAIRTAARRHGWKVSVDAEADSFTIVRRTL